MNDHKSLPDIFSALNKVGPPSWPRTFGVASTTYASTLRSKIDAPSVAVEVGVSVLNT